MSQSDQIQNALFTETFLEIVSSQIIYMFLKMPRFMSGKALWLDYLITGN